MNNLNPYILYQKALDTRWKWVIIILTLVYLISPVDAIPEILIPIVGWIDDGILLSLLIQGLLGNRARKSTKNDEQKHNTDKTIEGRYTEIK